ncbi:hypothetical protein PIB30_101043, partial [Stylosanthes scabra]|nr:hypothetical protein [Stylosanthes scabra]
TQMSVNIRNSRRVNSDSDPSPDTAMFVAAMNSMATAMRDSTAAMRESVAATNRAIGGDNDPENGNGRNDRLMTLATFLKVNPPSFSGATNVTKVDDWFHEMERSLRAQQEKLSLLGQDFELSFIRNTFLLLDLCHFSKIGQGNPAEFEEWKCIKYEAGLHEELLTFVGPMEIRNFAELVNKSQLAEYCTAKLAVARTSRQDQRRKKFYRNLAPEGQGFKRKGQSQRQFLQGEGRVQHGPECAKCGGHHVDKQCLFGIGICYNCGGSGDLARDCQYKRNEYMPPRLQPALPRPQQQGRVFAMKAKNDNGSLPNRNHEETEEEEENREQRKLESSYKESKLIQGNIK